MLALIRKVQLLKYICLPPKNLDFMRVSETVVMNIRTNTKPYNQAKSGVVVRFFFYHVQPEKIRKRHKNTKSSGRT